MNGMAILSAHVVTASGVDFTARIVNVTPSTVFVQTARMLAFKERLTISFLSISVPGTVVHASEEPSGLVVALDASPEQRVLIEDSVQGSDQVVWPDSKATLDRQPTLEHVMPSMTTERQSFNAPIPSPVTVKESPDVLRSPAGVADPDNVRLRATTVVGDRDTDEVFVDEITDHGIPI